MIILVNTFMRIQLIVIIFTFISLSSQGQQPPVLTYLTIDPYNSNVTLEWQPSSTSGILSYRIYYYDPVFDGNFRCDTVDGSITEHTFYFPEIENRSVQFSLDASLGEGLESILSNSLSTTHVRLYYDTCISQISLLWDITGTWPVTDSFIIHFMNDTSEIGSTTSKLFFTNQYPVNEDVCYYIERIYSGKRSVNSAKTCVYTGQEKPPLYINTNAVTVNNNNIEINFSIDPSSQTSQYYLIRSVNDTSKYDTIYKYLNENSKQIKYIDNKTSIDAINRYKLIAYNKCNKPVKTSNMGNNIVLHSSLNNNSANLSWNSYNAWLGGTDHYMLYKYYRNNTQFDSTYIPGNALNHIQDLTGQINEGYFDKVCYILEAREGTNNPYDIQGRSRSNLACIDIEPAIPNAFTPNDDGMNDTYQPVKMATAKNYKLIITDRWGYKVFESTDPGEEWNGNHPNKGRPEPGVYVFYLKFTTQDGREIVKNGNITVLVPDQN